MKTIVGICWGSGTLNSDFLFVTDAAALRRVGSVYRSSICQSVRQSARLSHRSIAVAACGGFVAERPVDSGRAAGAVQQASTLSSKCGQQRHVDSK